MRGSRIAFLGGVEARPPIFIPAWAFEITRGTPSLGLIGPTHTKEMTTWLLDDTVSEAVGTQYVLPFTGDISIIFFFAMESATAGSVRLALGYLAVGDGEDCNALGAIERVTVAVPATAKYLKVTSIVPTASVTKGDLLRLTANRFGSDALDTATGDLHFLGLGIEYI